MKIIRLAALVAAFIAFLPGYIAVCIWHILKEKERALRRSLSGLVR